MATAIPRNGTTKTATGKPFCRAQRERGGADHGAMFGGVDHAGNEFEFGHPAAQFGERDLQLEPGQMQAGAAMRAEPERQVRLGLAVEGHLVGLRVVLRITVGHGELAV